MGRRNKKSNLCGKLLYFVIGLLVFFSLLVIFPGLPPTMDFSPIEVQRPLPLSGPLSVNSKLNGAVQLFKDKLKGPECFAVYKDELYFSTYGGHIYKIQKDKLVHVLKTGDSCTESWEEHKCGRPLGLKFDKAGTLFIADAYKGIMKANISTGDISIEIPMNVLINNKQPMLPNFIDIAKDGSIYWSDSSTTFHLQDGVYVALGGGDGRLIKYNPQTKKNEVLIDGLFFANGVALSPDESFVVVAETFNRRLLRYHLKGPRAGKSDIFFDGLPGTPDNIRLNEKNELVVPLLSNSDDSSLLNNDFFRCNMVVRKILARTMGLLELISDMLYGLSANPIFEMFKHRVGHFESIMPLMKQDRVTIVFLNMKGEITRSLHSTDGRISSISDFIEFHGHYYLGSPFNPYLGRVVV